MSKFDAPSQNSSTHQTERVSTKREWIESVLRHLSSDERVEFVKKQGGIIRGEFYAHRSEEGLKMYLVGVFDQNEPEPYFAQLFSGKWNDENCPTEFRRLMMGREEAIREVIIRLREEYVRAVASCGKEMEDFKGEIAQAVNAHKRSPHWVKRVGASAIHKLAQSADMRIFGEPKEQLDTIAFGAEYIKRQAEYRDASREVDFDMSGIENERELANDVAFESVLLGRPMDMGMIEYRITRMHTVALYKLREQMNEIRKKLNLPIPEIPHPTSPYRG